MLSIKLIHIYMCEHIYIYMRKIHLLKSVEENIFIIMPLWGLIFKLTFESKHSFNP